MSKKQNKNVKKLVLGKKTVRYLTDVALGDVAGGGVTSLSCITVCKGCMV